MNIYGYGSIAPWELLAVTGFEFGWRFVSHRTPSAQLQRGMNTRFSYGKEASMTARKRNRPTSLQDLTLHHASPKNHSSKRGVEAVGHVRCARAVRSCMPKSWASG